MKPTSRISRLLLLVDTNCDPQFVDYLIPSNDDAIRAIKLLVGKIADAVMEGRTIRGKEEEEELLDQSMPAEISRFTDADEELEDEELLGESTLKHLGSSKKPKAKDEDLEDEEEEEELEEELEEEAETVAEAVEEAVEEEAEEVAEEIEEEVTEEAEAPADEEPKEDESEA